ncbi:ribosomal-protein-alanine N-acetyltransferase, partial [Streptococcus thermophilus]|nr:ribosomal-protein-alanine N-acetyltransferase [Streptococcus thermophilus]
MLRKFKEYFQKMTTGGNQRRQRVLA